MLAVWLGGGAVTASAAGDLVPASTMTTLLGSTFPATDIRQGLYSPDHSHVLYFGPQAVASGGQLHPSLGDFYVMRADGSQRTRLTNYTTILNTTVKLTSGMWAPDGTAVSFIHNAANQIGIDAAVLKTAKLATTAGQDAWTVTTFGEGVYAAGYTPDARYLVWEEHISDVFTIDVFAVDRITGAWHRLRWKAESPAGSPWAWAGECDLAAVAAAPLPAVAQRLPSVASDPLLDALAALNGPTPACFPMVASTPTETPTPAPSTPTPSTPTPTATPQPGSPTATPTPAQTETANPTPSPAGSTTPTPAPAPAPAGTTASGTPSPTPAPVKAPVFPAPPSANQAAAASTASSMLPAGSAAAIGTLEPSRTAGPEITIGGVGKRLRAAQRKSLNVRFTSTGATGVKAWLVLATGTTLPTLASTSTIPSTGGGGIIRFVLDAKAKRALRGLSRATVLVRLAAVDAGGHRTVVERRITLR